MKTSVILTVLFTVLFLQSRSQQSDVSDQNPRYKESLQKYTKVADTLTKNLGTTLQQTYKAYDFYEARLERRTQRREWRHQENMNRPYYYGSSWLGYSSPYYWSSPSYYYRYSPGYNRGSYYHSW